MRASSSCTAMAVLLLASVAVSTAAAVSARGSLTPTNASAEPSAAPAAPDSPAAPLPDEAPPPHNMLIQSHAGVPGPLRAQPRAQDDDNNTASSAAPGRFSTRAFIVTSRKGRILRTVRATQAPWRRAAANQSSVAGEMREALADDFEVIRWPTDAPETTTDGGGERPEAFQEGNQPRSAPGLAEPPPEVAVIQFRDVPGGDAYQLNNLDIGEGSDIFGYLSTFLSYVQPNDFPLDLLSDVLHNRAPLESIVFQVLQLEAGFLSLTLVYVLLALVCPCLCLCYACARICADGEDAATPASGASSRGGSRQPGAARGGGGGKRRQAAAQGESPLETPPDTPPPPACPPPSGPPPLEAWDPRVVDGYPCQQRSMLALLTSILFALLLSVGAQLATNQQVSVAVAGAPVVVQAALGDVDVFVRNARLQIDSLIVGTFRQAVLACREDLNNVDLLLGRPLQRELAAETGLDVALDALLDVAGASQAVSGKVQLLLQSLAEAKQAGLQVQDRLQELRSHVDALKRTCPRQERPLCDTLHVTGLHVTLNLNPVRNSSRVVDMTMTIYIGTVI
ncbi:uncharacterized protein LOC127748623 isoform X2 [Frankliniella occidentalis]|uniref:Uncharacterized protein LOC127748623 isoform X2 n=1 Tax=Frankliniella occidentalis TaxID=133901 RepID=A0A9C6UCJ1_FRAOC|nr:uncharacterized protein LOC127748623 isoform X2 [Frankliniella occidentalis]